MVTKERLPGGPKKSAPFLSPTTLNNIVDATKGIVSLLLVALGAPAGLLTTPSFVTAFTIKAALLYHDHRSKAKLQKAVDEATAYAKHARTIGTLIDFSKEENLLRLFKALEDLLEIRTTNKEKLLRNVVLGCLVRPPADDFQERNFRYITRTIEMEDLDILIGNLSIALDLGPSQPGKPNESTPGVPRICISRLFSAGLLDETRALQGSHYRQSALAKEYLKYIELPT